MFRAMVTALVLLATTAAANAAPLGQARVKATWQGVMKLARVKQGKTPYYVAPQLREMAKMDRLKVVLRGNEVHLVASSDKTGTVRSLVVNKKGKEIAQATTKLANGDTWYRLKFGMSRILQHEVTVKNIDAVRAQLKEKTGSRDEWLQEIHPGDKIVFATAYSRGHFDRGQTRVYTSRRTGTDFATGEALWENHALYELDYNATPTLNQSGK